ncbi:MAG: LemA family protein [Candidatus Pacebacteria bacterium]|nr:LemA family protein [Candidatus Paceibacterota bacterium]
MPLWIIGIVAVGLVLYVVSIYNILQRLKTQIKASIQEIGNQLKRQASLIPNLESSVKGYLKHEKDVFKMLTQARKSVAKATKTGKVSDIDKAIDKLQTAIPQIQVTVESNPELKADKTVTKFMDELTDTADKLSYARRSVIDLTQTYNEKLVTVPSKFVADIFGFKPEKGLSTPMGGDHLEVSEAETKDVKIKI